VVGSWAPFSSIQYKTANSGLGTGTVPSDPYDAAGIDGNDRRLVVEVTLAARCRK
jgi:hypothetical protein